MPPWQAAEEIARYGSDCDLRRRLRPVPGCLRQARAGGLCGVLRLHAAALREGGRVGLFGTTAWHPCHAHRDHSL